MYYLSEREVFTNLFNILYHLLFVIFYANQHKIKCWLNSMMIHHASMWTMTSDIHGLKSSRFCGFVEQTWSFTVPITISWKELGWAAREPPLLTPNKYWKVGLCSVSLIAAQMMNTLQDIFLRKLVKHSYLWRATSCHITRGGGQQFQTWQLHIRHSYSVNLFQNHWTNAGFRCRACMTNPIMNLSCTYQIVGWSEYLQQSDLELFPSPLMATETFSPMAQFFCFWILSQ
jgi:hypothetical protein